jgi:hypothetical protein
MSDALDDLMKKNLIEVFGQRISRAAFEGGAISVDNHRNSGESAPRPTIPT